MVHAGTKGTNTTALVTDDTYGIDSDLEKQLVDKNTEHNTTEAKKSLNMAHHNGKTVAKFFYGMDSLLQSHEDSCCDKIISGVTHCVYERGRIV